MYPRLEIDKTFLSRLHNYLERSIWFRRAFHMEEKHYQGIHNSSLTVTSARKFLQLNNFENKITFNIYI